jgi:hypothetical protein
LVTPDKTCWVSINVTKLTSLPACLPAVPALSVWGDLVTNAAGPQDIDQASNRILRGLLALSQALGASELQLANSQGLKPVQLDKTTWLPFDDSRRGPQPQAVTWSHSC